MRNSLRQMIDSGMLAAASPAAAPATKKFPTGDSDDDEAPQELHVHIHPPMEQDPSDADQDPSDTDADQDEDDEDQDDDQPTGASKNASPAALNIAKTVQDPVGATKKTFGKLAKTKMAYDLAREEAKRNLVGPQQVLQHVSNMHQLNDPMTGLPMGMQPNPADANGGVNPNGQPGNGAPPPNMDQAPGNQQRNPNGPPGVGAGPKLNPPTANPGSATQGAQTQVRPPKQGVPKPGQGNAGTKAGNPSSKNGGKSIKLEVKSAAELGTKRMGRRQIEAGAALSNLRF